MRVHTESVSRATNVQHKDLLSNPAFNHCIEYAPKRLYEDAFAEKPIISEMWTADWWEEIQVRAFIFRAESTVQVASQKVLPSGATVAPVILASDKTQLSTFSGDKSAWPVYLSIGNIAKATRCSPSARAMVLIGYLPVAKLECFSKKQRAQKRYQLFHDCMRSLLVPLVKAGLEGVDIECGDGFIRKVFPILAAYIADHPEQCLIACCQENFCPQCLVDPTQRGDPIESVRRDVPVSLGMIQKALKGDKPEEFKTSGLRPVLPFWADMPHCNIFTCFTPNILHQLHKGMFKDHTVKWVAESINGGEDEVDQRFRAMSPHGDLRYFKKGISLISQWTGNEYKHMEKVFLGVVAGAATDERVLLAVRSLLDFIYYAHFEIHTSESLAHLETAWRTFHHNKQVFLDLGVRDDFNFAKLHSLGHYLRAILRLGSADGYNTEGPERLHIDFAKLGYRASNRKQYIRQMTKWLERREAVYRFEAYLEWLKVLPADDDAAEDADDADADDDSDDEDGDDGAPSEGDPQVKRTRKTLVPEVEEEGEETSDTFSCAPSPQPHRQSTDPLSPIAPIRYTIAKHPPFPNTPVSTIVSESNYGATDFIHALETYLRIADTSHLTRSEVAALGDIGIQDDSVLNVYKQIKLDLPVMGQVTQKATRDTIRAVHAVPPEGLHPGSPAHFATALVIDKKQRGSSRDSVHHVGNPIVGEESSTKNPGFTDLSPECRRSPRRPDSRDLQASGALPNTGEASSRVRRVVHAVPGS